MPEWELRKTWGEAFFLASHREPLRTMTFHVRMTLGGAEAKLVRRREQAGARPIRRSPSLPPSTRRTQPPRALPGEALLERMPVPLAIVDEAHVLWANGAMQTLLGYTDRGALVGLPLTGLALPGRNAQDERWLRADGTAVSLEVHRMQIEHGTLVVARETMRSDRLAAQLLADRLAPAGTFAAGLAHQINNPLAYLLANLSYLEEELPEILEDMRTGRAGDAEIAEQKRELMLALEDARHGAQRVASIVRDLKMLSSVDDDSVEDVDLQSLLDSAYNVVQSQVQARARVIKDYKAVPRVLGSEARLVQVFVDLLLNAAQAIPEGEPGGDVRLATSTDADGWACVSISDTGAGIPAELVPRIFDPFFTTKPVGEGTGLGLAICHGIVTSLSGRIHVESELGKGTTFRVILPPTDYTRTIARQTLRASPPNTQRLRILIVDDEAHLVQALRRTLGGKHDLTTTTLPNEALARITGGESFDVILCDVVMPETSGIELYERVRAKFPEQADRFIFMTGGAFTQRMRKFLGRIENLTLDKPFSAARLMEVLDGVHPLSDRRKAT